jgi:lysophospholipase L1-like esterase
MRTTYRIPAPYAEQFLKLADEYRCESPARPLRFIEKMKENRGAVSAITQKGLDAEGLERRNPVIVALGDSVTAGHFESLLPRDPEALRAMVQGQTGASEGEMPPVEITDARESYIEKFRLALIDKYEQTSVSVLNAGIAGDVLPMMLKRADRDVVRHDPDLVLINGSLNWDDGSMGDAAVYKELLRKLVRKLKAETEADIILLTPNGDLPNRLLEKIGIPAVEPTTPARVQAIRELAAEEQVCLADARAVWDKAAEAGIPWELLLTNGINHPSVEGHEVYAKVLMKLFED